MGHLIRSLTLAEGLSKRFELVFLNGGPIPDGIERPDDFEIVDLPPLGMGRDAQLVSRAASYSVCGARRHRREIILDKFRQLEPDVLFIELFPFGRKKFSGELLPVLEEANRLGPRAPLTLCSLRDLLISKRVDQRRHDWRASLLANRYFDAVLVHADQTFAQLEESFKPEVALKIPVLYTGFVFGNKPDAAHARREISTRRRILVSAGGGQVGGPLLRTAVAAHQILWKKERVEMTLVAGPFLPEPEWNQLAGVANEAEGLELIRSVPDLCAEMRASVASISQCGYNTAMDILRSRVPALVVPFTQGSENEQTQRARKLERLGAVWVLHPEQMDASTLAAEIGRLLNFHPQKVDLDLDGGAGTVRIVAELLQQRKSQDERLVPKPWLNLWLDPLREALDTAAQPVEFFFRDDDAGWENERLFKLLDLFEQFGLPLDLAVIPMALILNLSQQLLKRLQSASHHIGIHQHGFAHTDHETGGRKCEFGPERNYCAQLHDLHLGRQRMEELFGAVVDPFFTPPWNRCTEVTGRCLTELGFSCLSRDVTATPLNIPGLYELPVRIDWFAKSKGVYLSRAQLGKKLAEQAQLNLPVGVMFHHAIMDEKERRDAEELLFLLATHGNVRCRSMKAIVEQHASGVKAGFEKLVRTEPVVLS